MLESVFASPRVQALFPRLDELARDFASRAAEHDRAGSCPGENFPPLIQAGIPALSVPERLGGQGYDLVETLFVVERLARGCPSTALILAMTLHLVGGAADAEVWPEPVYAALCESVLQGALINSVASEPELGSPSRGGLPCTQAEQVDGAWRLTGRKTFATGAPVLTHFLVQARIQDEIGEFLVLSSDPGLRIDPTWDTLGMRATASHDLVLEGAVGSLMRRFTGDRFKRSPRPWFYLSVAAVYLGLAACCAREAAAYACSRRPTNLGGKSIAELESVRALMGQLEAERLQAGSLLYTVARAACDPLLGPEVGLAKVRATEAALQAAQLAARIVGGAALDRRLPFERLLRDAQAGPFHPPNPAQALDALAFINR